MQPKLSYRATFTDAKGNRLARRIVAAHDNQARIIASSLAQRNGWTVVSVGRSHY